ncbi:MAG: hypothetical protein RL410_930 [Actinomycetota bacterium]|jgi:hypothetical protein
MNLEEFENQFATQDAAKNLAPLSDNQRAELVAHATSAPAPRLRTPVSRKAILTSAAAVAALAIAIPSSLSAPTTSDAPYISLGAYKSASGDTAMKVAGNASSSMVTADQAMFPGGLNHYIFDASTLNNPFGALHTAYKIVEIDNLENRVNDIIDALGVDNVTRHSEDGNVWWTNEPDKDGNYVSGVASVYIYNGPWAGWSYYNPKLDSQICTDSKSSDGTSVSTACEVRIPSNLLSKSAALAKAKSLAASWGLATSGDWRWTTEINQAQTSDTYFDANVAVTAQLYVDEIAAPISISFTFADNGELFAAWGSLQDIRVLGNYKIASPEVVLTRANDATSKAIAEYKEQREKQTPQPSASDGTYVSDPGLATWNPTATEVVVKSLKVSMILVNDDKGNQLWIPAYDITGYFKGTSDSPEGSIAQEIAVDSSQIDLSAFRGPIANFSKGAVAY